MTEVQRRRLRAVKTFAQLIDFLRDELDWPIDQGHDEEDLTFDWSDDLGLKYEERVGIKQIKQLRPLETGQPWGIFFVDFEKKHLPIVILRRILNALVLKKRANANRAQQAAWQQRDLLFISAYGQENERQLTFAHFSEPTNDFDPRKATLRVLGWDDDETNLKLDYVADMLKAKLTWPSDTSDMNAWRQRWSEAFELRHRQVIDTAADLALRLAELAKRIRNRMLQVLPRESENGELRKLLKGFQTALIHDLDEARFADMYAQTITYGLFSAAVSRTVPGAGTAVHQGNVVDMVPVTNPFLRDMLSSFLKAGGRRGKFDFDELGIQEVVDLLNDPKTHMEAVLRDFGNRTRGEDPVIHFYEEFLKAYDKKLKADRGVFYTPQPVVSYIVRSVHELLQTEFGLEEGLADTTTWGEMLKKHPDLKLPLLTDELGEKRTISPDEPFVQILDPATGTATFLVEVIDLIYRTLATKWRQQRLTDVQQRGAWNEYVPKHLLPRLHAFELMMAPYAIAHMKIGLKLAETGYRFGAEERARVYLTNALEPWVKQLPLIGFDALAHEAAAVNEVKRHKRFTVVVGNPPYAALSANLTDTARELVRRFKFIDGVRVKERGALQLEKNLQEDYVKFLAFAEDRLDESATGVCGMICNHGFIDNPTLRGVRWSLSNNFHQIWVLDLHGNVNRGEKAPDGTDDQNVFDIKDAGVAIYLGLKGGRKVATDSQVRKGDLWGDRETQKYPFLRANTCGTHNWEDVSSEPELFLFRTLSQHGSGEYNAWPKVTDIFPRHSIGMITARDGYVIDFSSEPIVERAKAFRDSTLGDEATCKALGIPIKKGWNITRARERIRSVKDLAAHVRQVLYRPFDVRPVFYHESLIWGMAWPVMQHMVEGRNLALITSRMTKGEAFQHVLVSNTLSEVILLSSKTSNNAFAFPLHLKSENSGLQFGECANLAPQFLSSVANTLGLTRDKSSGLPVGLTPEDIFRYAYAVFHSPGYRSRYAEFLKIDFPRLPLTGNLGLFCALARLGGELTSFHLLESPRLANPITEFVGARNAEVEKVSWSKNTVWIDKAQTAGFKGVAEEVWSFHIGGYQVCEKWLKDRKSRTLSNDDIVHYQRIVVALSETIRLMAEIDRVIDAHGGWPGAFQTAATA